MSALDSLSKLLRYEIQGVKPVARGGCGHVWCALDTLFDRKVALKTIDPPLLWERPDRAQRSFQKEAVAGARLGELSRNIVKVFDVGRVDDIMYFAMEWIEPQQDGVGIDISHLLGNVSLAQAKTVLFQVCEAVEIAHSNGIVHSDIAPWNIVFDAQRGVFKLSDFGLLKIVESTLVSAASGSLLIGGRRDYLPVRARDDVTQIGQSTDVYALAVTFRALLEGLERVQGRAETTPQVIRIRQEQRDAPDAVRQLLTRFVEGHTVADSAREFVTMLSRVPN